MPDNPTPKVTPLRTEHVALGAQFTEFAGWEMPVRYTSDIAEHGAVRTAVGVFDLSHMGELRVQGTDAGAYLDAALAGRYSNMPLGRAKYSLLLERGVGATSIGIVDDLVVYRLDDDDFLIVANAANTSVDVETLSARTDGFDVTVTDATADIALIAVQGPASRSVVEDVVVLDPSSPLALPTFGDLKYYRVTAGTFDGQPLLVARTGYTGEDGFELYTAAEHAAALWDRLIVDARTTPCGLACRDTLRLEAGMPLYGHELTRETTPWMAGLGRVVVLDKARSAVPLDALQTAADAQTARQLVGLSGHGRRAARAGSLIVDTAGNEIGKVTSGVLSPTLRVPIAMAYLDSSYATPGTIVDVDVRGKRQPMTVTTLPFYKQSTRN